MIDRGCDGCIFRECDSTGYICSINDGYLSDMDCCPLDEEGFRMSISGNPISTTFPVSVQNGKGGEKRMASEWEELEKLTKDELIIELVKERVSHRELERSIRGLIDYDYPADKRLSVFVDDDEPGYGSTTEDWAYRIACYAYEHAEDKDDFGPYDLGHYGLNDDLSENIYMKLRSDGVITNDKHDLAGYFDE